MRMTVKVCARAPKITNYAKFTTVRRIGPFEGTYDEFLALRDRAVNRLAGLEAYDKAFMEARVAAHKARAK